VGLIGVCHIEVVGFIDSSIEVVGLIVYSIGYIVYSSRESYSHVLEREMAAALK
jgi:predicted membrane channel-forming protein YqfA (hemolysin III family)